MAKPSLTLNCNPKRHTLSPISPNRLDDPKLIKPLQSPKDPKDLVIMYLCTWVTDSSFVGQYSEEYLIIGYLDRTLRVPGIPDP